jgi:hypothetical protein
MAAVAAVVLTSCGGSSSTADKSTTTTRPAAVYSVRAMYVVPKDVADKGRVQNGQIVRSIDAIDMWLKGQTGGESLRFDRNAADEPIVEFFRMTKTDAEVTSSGVYVRDKIEEDLEAAGKIDGHKIYAVYYEGNSTAACGASAWPPELVGHVAAEYLDGNPPNSPACNTNEPGTSATAPEYTDFGMLHEIMHAIGLVSTCAPHHTTGDYESHVTDGSTDLMYAGDQPWYPSQLDIGHDDYFGGDHHTCFDLQDSAFFGHGTHPPPGW